MAPLMRREEDEERRSLKKAEDAAAPGMKTLDLRACVPAPTNAFTGLSALRNLRARL